VEILQDQHHRLVQDKMPDELRHAVEELTVVHRALIGSAPGDAQLREKAGELLPPDRIEALENLSFFIEVAGAKHVDPRGERQDLLGLVAAPYEHAASARGRLGGDLGQQATLADARLADHCHDLAVSRPRAVQHLP
jgi:hypothetical protein